MRRLRDPGYAWRTEGLQIKPRRLALGLVGQNHVHERADVDLHHVDVGNSQLNTLKDEGELGAAEHHGLRTLLADDALGNSAELALRTLRPLPPGCQCP